MSRKNMISTFMVVLIFLLSLILACTNPTPSPVPAPTIAPTTAPAPAPKVLPSQAPSLPPAPTSTVTTPSSATTLSKKIKIIINHYGPQSIITKPMEWFVDEVSKRTNGMVEMPIGYGGPLADSNHMQESMGIGLFDMGFVINGATPALLPLWNMFNLPFTSDNQEAAGKAQMEMAKRPELIAEAKSLNIRYLFPVPLPSYGIASAKVPIKVPEDMKGLKVRSYADIGKVISFYGGTPVSLTTAEFYTAMQSGVVDACVQPWSYGMTSYKMYEVAKYLTDMKFGVQGNWVAMNLDKWNSLPDSVKKLFDELALETPALYAKYCNESRQEDYKLWQKVGDTIFTISDADYQRMVKDVGLGIQDRWVQDKTKAGKPEARNLLDQYLQLIKKYGG